MEAGSLLQEAISRQAEAQDESHAVHLDMFLLPDDERSSMSNIPSTMDGNDDRLPQQLLNLAELARDVNIFFQQQHYKWHLGGDGPIFGIAASDGIPHLRAICRYGANVADEWAAIKYVLEFSRSGTSGKKWSKIAIECWDVQDGQILLIESANVLPPWVDHIGPEACRRRCWIRKGRIQLLSPKNGVENPESIFSLSLQAALEALGQQQKGETAASLTTTNCIIETPEVVQTVIHDCIVRFLSFGTSGNGENHTSDHKAALAVPRSVACLIQQRPDLVNAAIVSFANHALHPETTAKVKPSNSKNNIACENWVWTTHSFSRTNYAMLRTIVSPTWKTESHIPKAYQSVELRRAQRQCAVEATPHLRHAVQVGVRLVVGFDIMLQEQQSNSLMSLPSSLQERRILHYWPRLLQQDLKGSAQWIIDAWQAGPNNSPYNLDNILKCPVVTEELELDPNNITLLSHPDTTLPNQIQRELRKSETSDYEFVLPHRDEVDSNEDWMMLSPDTVDEQMESMTGDTNSKKKRERVKTFSSAKKTQMQKDKEHAAQLNTMLDGFENFMVDMSGVEGVSHNQREQTVDSPPKASPADNVPTKSIVAKQDELNVNPRVFLHLLKTVLDPSTSVSSIQFPVSNQSGDSGDSDDFFSRDDYESMLPDGDDDYGDDENFPVDKRVLQLMVRNIRRNFYILHCRNQCHLTPSHSLRDPISGRYGQ